MFPFSMVHSCSIPMFLGSIAAFKSDLKLVKAVTWWFIPLSKWFITLVISGHCPHKNPIYNQGYKTLTIRGMNHQVRIYPHHIPRTLRESNVAIEQMSLPALNFLYDVFCPQTIAKVLTTPKNLDS